jgi:DNA replication protein DnaC
MLNQPTLEKLHALRLHGMAEGFRAQSEQIGDPTLADSILDRLVHNAHRIEMRGESMRKKRNGKE